MLSIVIPCFNGAVSLSKSLPEVIKNLNCNSLDFEIIIVDDGSKDFIYTQNVAKKFNCKFIQNKKNLGKGNAVRKGVLKAKGDVIIYTDVDIPFGSKSILNFYNTIKNNKCDVLIGDRTESVKNYYDKIPVNRKIVSKIFSFIIMKWILKKSFDTQCGLKGFTKQSAIFLFSRGFVNGFAFDVELLLMAIQKKYIIQKYPIQFVSVQGKVSFNLIKQAFTMLIDLIKIKYYYSLKSIKN
jgi:dolichyl-phosphate beta-glucosyltransferase